MFTDKLKILKLTGKKLRHVTREELERFLRMYEITAIQSTTRSDNFYALFIGDSHIGFVYDF